MKKRAKSMTLAVVTVIAAMMASCASHAPRAPQETAATTFTIPAWCSDIDSPLYFIDAAGNALQGEIPTASARVFLRGFMGIASGISLDGVAIHFDRFEFSPWDAPLALPVETPSSDAPSTDGLPAATASPENASHFVIRDFSVAPRAQDGTGGFLDTLPVSIDPPDGAINLRGWKLLPAAESSLAFDPEGLLLESATVASATGTRSTARTRVSPLRIAQKWKARFEVAGKIVVSADIDGEKDVLLDTPLWETGATGKLTLSATVADPRGAGALNLKWIAFRDSGEIIASRMRVFEGGKKPLDWGLSVKKGTKDDLVVVRVPLGLGTGGLLSMPVSSLPSEPVFPEKGAFRITGIEAPLYFPLGPWTLRAGGGDLSVKGEDWYLESPASTIYIQGCVLRAGPVSVRADKGTGGRLVIELRDDAAVSGSIDEAGRFFLHGARLEQYERGRGGSPLDYPRLSGTLAWKSAWTEAAVDLGKCVVNRDGRLRRERADSLDCTVGSLSMKMAGVVVSASGGGEAFAGRRLDLKATSVELSARDPASLPPIRVREAGFSGGFRLSGLFESFSCAFPGVPARTTRFFLSALYPSAPANAGLSGEGFLVPEAGQDSGAAAATSAAASGGFIAKPLSRFSIDTATGKIEYTAKRVVKRRL